MSGDGSSVRTLEKYFEETKDPDLAAAAVASLEILHARLKLNPEELLQASTMPDDSLLKPANSVSDKELLTITGSDHEHQQTKSVLNLGNRQH